MKNNSLFETVKLSAVDIFSEEGLQKRLASGKALKIKKVSFHCIRKSAGQHESHRDFQR